MLDHQGSGRDLASFVLPEIGQLLETGDQWAPYRLVEPTGELVQPVALYFKDPEASCMGGSAPGTRRRAVRVAALDPMKIFALANPQVNPRVFLRRSKQ